MTLPDTLYLNDTRYAKQQATPPSSDLYRVLTDAEIGRTDRPSMPMVFVFMEGAPVTLTPEWQIFIAGINYRMDLHNIAALTDYKKAFCNTMGTGNPSEPVRNYITGENLDAVDEQGRPAYPKLDKVRTCGGAVLKIADGYVYMMDGTRPPPLKPGAVYPQTVAQARANPDVYACTPWGTPHLFFECVATGPAPAYRVNPFPNGGQYDYHPAAVTWMPHVSPRPVRWPLVEYSGKNRPVVVRI